jgi:hypothetical protein
MARTGAVCLFVLLALALPAQEPAPGAATTKATPKDPFATVRAARDGDRYQMLLRQFRADEPALPERHEAGRRDAVAAYGGQRDLPAAHWVWVRPCWFLFRDGPEDAAPSRPSGPEQACGAPDTPEAGDQLSAWASREQDAEGEWLLLEFGAPIRATKLEVHETFNPGALARVTVFNHDGDELEVWQARDVAAVAEPKRTLAIDLPLGFVVERVRLHLQSERVPGWNEIDAVGLHDDQGHVHWAARAVASSTFAEREPLGRLPLARGAFRVEVARLAPVVEFKLGDVGVRNHAVELRLVQDVLRARLAQPPGALPPAAPVPGAPRLVTIPLHRPAPPPVPAPAPAVDPAAPARAAVLQARIAALQAEIERLRADVEQLRNAPGR